MTSTVDTANTNGLLPTKAHDGRTMVGHVVVTPGCDEHAEDAVAVWQVATVRTAFEKHTNEMASDRDITPIEWPVDLPDHIPSTVEEMWWATRLELPLSSPVTQAALTTAALARWTVQRWQETMTALGRRRYLREAFGPQRVLPPAWETRLADAYESHRGLELTA